MSWAYVAVAAISVVGAASSADASRKAGHQQQDAINQAQADDAQQAAAAKTLANTTANAKLAGDKRARQANVLALGGPTDNLGTDDLGGSASVLAGGAAARANNNASVLGGGAPVSAGTVSPGSAGSMSGFGRVSRAGAY